MISKPLYKVGIGAMEIHLRIKRVHSYILLQMLGYKESG
jgi:hypothetical protein